MKWIKLIGVSIINAVILILTFIVVGNILHSLTGQYVDQVNVSSIVTCLACLGLFAGATPLESKRLNLPKWAIVGLSLFITVIGGAGIAVAVAVIAGGIG